MRKAKTAVAELRQMRIKERNAAAQKPPSPPSEIYLSVLGNGAPGSPRSLYMFTDHSRYLFNCGEGTQRLAHEYKMKLSKLQHIFITHKSWKNLGGLLGLSLTVQDIGVPQITLHGPPDIEDLYSYTRSFIITKDLHIEKRFHTDPPFVDRCMQVEYVALRSSVIKSKPESTSNGTNFDSEENLNHSEKKRKLSDDKCQDIAVAYICKGHSKPGHLVLQKCLEQGVPPGPLLGELKNGNDVTLPSGKIVHSQDVISPEEKCPIFIVVECPTEDFLDSLLNEEKLKNCQSTSCHETAALVIHFTPTSVVATCKYQEWINRFPESTCHLILNENCSSANSAAIHRVQNMLNLLHPRMFSLLHETEVSTPDILCNKPNVFFANTLDRYYLRPHKAFDRSFSVIIDPNMYIQEAKSTPGFEDSLKVLHQLITGEISLNSSGIYCIIKRGLFVLDMSQSQKVNSSDDACVLAIKVEEYPEVVFLGTGSCIPSKVRNVSGILVNLSTDCSFLLDCGEGSYGQILRIYGSQDTKSILQKLKCIFISHVHADHHLGLFTILKERDLAFCSSDIDYSPVTIIAPEMIRLWLMKYNQMCEEISFYRFIENSQLRNDKTDDLTFEEKCLIKCCENMQIATVPVIHCPNAYGIILKHPTKWKLVYSGDTIPCQKLIDAGKDCSLLIHEATMEDDLEEEAAIKMHSTTTQAIQVAEQMSAKYTILTHFSQRYAKVPMFNEKFHNHIGCAFDNMKVRSCDLPILSLFIPTLQILFAEHVEKLQEKGNKRKRKLMQTDASNESSEAVNT